MVPPMLRAKNVNRSLLTMTGSSLLDLSSVRVLGALEGGVRALGVGVAVAEGVAKEGWVEECLLLSPRRHWLARPVAIASATHPVTRLQMIVAASAHRTS